MYEDALWKQAGSRRRPQLGRDVGGKRGGGMQYAEGPGKRRRRRSVKAGRLATLALLMVLCFITLVLVIVPRATGSQTYAVLTDSMAPTYSQGTLLVVQPAAFSQLQYGDVVTFQLKSGQPGIDIRRIVGFGATDTDERTLITRGDTHDAADPVPVRALQVKGKLLYAVPLVGYLDNALDKEDPNLWMAVAAAALIGYGLLLIFRIFRNWRR